MNPGADDNDDDDDDDQLLLVVEVSDGSECTKGAEDTKLEEVGAHMECADEPKVCGLQKGGFSEEGELRSG